MPRMQKGSIAVPASLHVVYVCAWPCAWTCARTRARASARARASETEYVGVCDEDENENEMDMGYIP